MVVKVTIPHINVMTANIPTISFTANHLISIVELEGVTLLVAMILIYNQTNNTFSNSNSFVDCKTINNNNINFSQEAIKDTVDLVVMVELSNILRNLMEVTKDMEQLVIMLGLVLLLITLHKVAATQGNLR